jgi:hypothetical protein
MVARPTVALQMTRLVLKRASTTSPWGEWDQDDYDVFADRGEPWSAGSCVPMQPRLDALAVDAGLRAS